MHGAKERGARTKLGPPRACERMLRDTSPADRPRLSGNWWVSPSTVDARTRGTLGEAVVRLPLTGCTADPGGRPGWVAASSAGLTWGLRFNTRGPFDLPVQEQSMLRRDPPVLATGPCVALP